MSDGLLIVPLRYHFERDGGACAGAYGSLFRRRGAVRLSETARARHAASQGKGGKGKNGKGEK